MPRRSRSVKPRIAPSIISVKLTETKPPDYAWARERMVQDQLIARGIQDRRVIAAMRRIPRHLFIDSGLVNRAYDDSALPIGQKQTLSQPYMAARMTEALGLSGKEKVLEIGTGSGYQTALLAELCFNVFSVEKIRALSHKARELLDRLGFHNIALHVGDGTVGWSEHASYDAIIVAVNHKEYCDYTEDCFKEMMGENGVLVDIKGIYRNKIKNPNYKYWCL